MKTEAHQPKLGGSRHTQYYPRCSGTARLRRLAFLARRATLVGLLVMAAPGCRKKSSSSLDHLIPRRTQAVRIASTVPAATQILLEIGAGRDLVGVSSFDRPLLPARMQSLPVVGNYLHLDYETLLNVKPTVLVVQMAPIRLPISLTHFARQNRIALVNVQLNTLQQLYSTVKQLGVVTGLAGRAATVITQCKARLKAIGLKYSRSLHPRVVFLIGANPLRAAGRHTFLNQLIRVAGGNNVGEKLGAGYPSLTRETLVDLKPQVLLIGLPGEPAASGWNDPRLEPWLALPIPAAKKRRVYLVTGLRSQMPTMETYKTAALFGHLIHGADIRKLGG